MEFRRPTAENVELGDYLVEYSNRKFLLLPISRVNPGDVEASIKYDSGGSESSSKAYVDAVILKQNGTYLVGESVNTTSFRIK